MTMIVSADDSVGSNSAEISGAPAVRITGKRVSYTNTATGKITSTDAAVAALEIDGEDGTIINEADGRISAASWGGLAIRGSAGADTIHNAGIIAGRVELGAGDDYFLDLNGGYYTPVDLGEGDDVFESRGVVSGVMFLPPADGGAGYDRYILSGQGRQLFGRDVSGFERLEVGAGLNPEGNPYTWNLLEFSGFEALALAAGGYYNFVDSANPAADVTVSGGYFSISLRSSFRDVTGSASSDSVHVNSGTVRNVSLGGGDDHFFLQRYSLGNPMPTVSGTVDGGTGTDTLFLDIVGGATVDVSQMSGFENLNGGTWSSLASDVRVINANDYLLITPDAGGKLTLAHSSSPLARVEVPYKTIFVLEATATVGQIGASSGWLVSATQGQADNITSVTIEGTVLGAVHLGTGHDSFDASLGTIGGAVYGYAGDDGLKTGEGAQSLYGGHGDDRLDGGPGNDTLDGGDGIDTADYSAAHLGVAVNLTNAAVTLHRVPGYMTNVGANEAVAGWEVRDSLRGIENVRTGGGDDVVIGNEGANRVDAGGGWDQIVGGGGDDVLLGEDGDDTLWGDAGADRLEGGADHDWLLGGDGDDQLFGDSGNDRFRGGTGADHFDGGSDTGANELTGYGDRVSFSDRRSTQGVVADLRTGLVSNDGFGTADTMTNIESLGADTPFADTLYGDDGVNFLWAARNDTLYGFGGDDIVRVSAAPATADGGEGIDTLELYSDGGWLLMVARPNGEWGSAAPYTAGWIADLAAGTVQDGWGEVGAITAFENIRGGSTGDTLLGDGAANRLEGGEGNDTLDGRGGADTLLGGLGNDIFVVDDGGDVVTELADEGIDEVRTSLGSRVDYALMYVLPAHVENLTGTSAGAQGVYGNALNNIVTMGGGGDLIVMHDGGDDTVFAGGGNDFIHFGGAFTAADKVDGGAGYDTVGLIGSYTLTLSATSLTNVEKFALYSNGDASGATANNYNMTMHDANVASGQTLMVVAQSLLAHETLVFDGSAETNGKFNIRGGRGNDTITGGGQADQIWGGLGADTLRGGGGRDAFEYLSVAESTAQSRDTILDFTQGDRINLVAIDADGNAANGNGAFSFIGASAFTGTAGQLRATQIQGNDWLIEADTNGDGNADLVIGLTTTDGDPITAGDFWL